MVSQRSVMFCGGKRPYPIQSICDIAFNIWYQKLSTQISKFDPKTSSPPWKEPTNIVQTTTRPVEYSILRQQILITTFHTTNIGLVSLSLDNLASRMLVDNVTPGWFVTIECQIVRGANLSSSKLFTVPNCPGAKFLYNPDLFFRWGVGSVKTPQIVWHNMDGGDAFVLGMRIVHLKWFQLHFEEWHFHPIIHTRVLHQEN